MMGCIKVQITGFGIYKGHIFNHGAGIQTTGSLPGRKIIDNGSEPLALEIPCSVTAVVNVVIKVNRSGISGNIEHGLGRSGSVVNHDIVFDVEGCGGITAKGYNSISFIGSSATHVNGIVQCREGFVCPAINADSVDFIVIIRINGDEVIAHFAVDLSQADSIHTAGGILETMHFVSGYQHVIGG
jgi:hypothetical protein